MYVTPEQLVEITGLKRSSCQAKALSEMYPGIRFTHRQDGTVALRQEELDYYTLTRKPHEKRRRSLDLDLFRRTG